MKVATTLGLVLSLVSTSVLAEGIRRKPETLTPGDYTSINQSQEGLIHHVYRGKVGRHYIFGQLSRVLPVRKARVYNLLG